MDSDSGLFAPGPERRQHPGGSQQTHEQPGATAGDDGRAQPRRRTGHRRGRQRKGPVPTQQEDQLRRCALQQPVPDHGQAPLRFEGSAVSRTLSASALPCRDYVPNKYTRQLGCPTKACLSVLMEAEFSRPRCA